MENKSSDLFDGTHSLGSVRGDFGTICKDCATGSIGYRQVHFYADKTKLETFTRWKCGGGKQVVTQHPLRTFDFCYYHCKERGLLPYQNTLRKAKGETQFGKQS